MTDRTCYDTSESKTVMPRMGSPFSRLTEGFWDYDFSDSFDPRYEVRENDDGFQILLELPGIKKEEVHIRIADGRLWVKGERKIPDLKKAENCSCSGLSYGPFDLSFDLPDTVETEKVDAHMENGILELKITKKPETKRKEVEVKID